MPHASHQSTVKALCHAPDLTPNTPLPPGVTVADFARRTRVWLDAFDAADALGKGSDFCFRAAEAAEAEYISQCLGAVSSPVESLLPAPGALPVQSEKVIRRSVALVPAMYRDIVDLAVAGHRSVDAQIRLLVAEGLNHRCQKMASISGGSHAENSKPAGATVRKDGHGASTPWAVNGKLQAPWTASC